MPKKTLILKFDFSKLASPDLDRNFWSADIETVQSPAAYICILLAWLRKLSPAASAAIERKALPLTRHVPGSQLPFSLIPDPDQNKEDTSFISVVAYGVYIPLSRPIQFHHLPKPKFREKCPRSCRSCETLDPGSEWVFADFHGVEITSSKKSPVI